MELRELIRDTLREKMESQYKTLTAFAKASGVSQSYLSKIFGEVAVDISPTILSKLLSPLGVSLSQFFTDVEKKKAVLNIRLSGAELQQLMDMIPNGKEKQGFLAKLRETITELPAWLKSGGGVPACLDGRRRVCSRMQGQRGPLHACPAGRRARLRALRRRVSGRWRIDSACRRHADRRGRRRVHRRGASALG